MDVILFLLLNPPAPQKEKKKRKGCHVCLEVLCKICIHFFSFSTLQKCGKGHPTSKLVFEGRSVGRG